MFDPGRDAPHQTDPASQPGGPTPGERRDPAEQLRGHGGQYARLLRERRPGTRASGSGWRSYADQTADVAGDDPEVHQILIDVSVAAQHLASDHALRAYASAKRRRVSGPLAIAFLDGMLDRIARFPQDARREGH